ncbi:hypothetical protein HY631_02750 [Candidatus Uhrbacteria bacterium]|nr:hypothetical protein [Candidatus Uhrbacteria bacterium]
MVLALVAFMFVLNFAISWFNAWSCGRAWNETRAVGGFAHFMNWMGAIMSASGFTWCYLIVLVVGGTFIPITDGEGVQAVTAPLVSEAMAKASLELGYLVVYFPIVGSGLAITLQSWAHFYRERSLKNGAIAGWNTFAQIYNIGSGLRNVPSAFSGVSSFFKGDDKGKLLVILLVIGAVIGGIATTALIIRSTARRVARDAELDYHRARAA